MEITQENDEFKFECPSAMLEEHAGREYRNVVEIKYFSNVTGGIRSANVVLPNGYTDKKKYSTVYMFHGFFGNERTLLYDEDCRIPEIMGNMLDAGEAREVITVFPNLYVNSDPTLKPGFTVQAVRPYYRFIDELVDSLLPYVESNFSVSKKPEDRALIGFSIGGLCAIDIALKRSDLFPNVASISPSPGLLHYKDWAMEHPGMYVFDDFKPMQADYPIRNFLLCIGDKDGVVGTNPLEYHKRLEANHVEHIWYQAPGLEHGEKIVQSGVYNFMKRWK